jgi:hypothetical protein
MSNQQTSPENPQTPTLLTSAEITQILLDAGWDPQRLQEKVSRPYRWPSLVMIRDRKANADAALETDENTLVVPTGEASVAHPAGSGKSMAVAKIVADIMARNAPTDVENA